MYAIVGCGECSNLWIVEGAPETSQCPRCGSRKPFDRRKRFLETGDVNHAREVRASMLANRSGHGEAFAAVECFADLEDAVGESVIEEASFLEASGVDPEAVEAAGERVSAGTGGGASRRDVVFEALDSLEEPTAAEVKAFASDRGVPIEYTERALEKLVQAGEVLENRGRYRRI